MPQNPIDEISIDEQPIDETPIDETPVNEQPLTSRMPDASELYNPSALNPIAPISSHDEANKGFLHSLYDSVADRVNQSPIGKIWNAVNEPLINRLQTPQMAQAREQFGQEHPIAGAVGNMAVAGLSNPLNLATMGSFAAGNVLKAPSLIRAGKILSAPVAAEGAINLASPHSTGMERVLGAVELAGGRAGMKAKMPELKASELPTLTTSQLPQIEEAVMKNYAKDIGGIRANSPHRVILDRTSKEIVTKLVELGYRPGGIVDDGPYKGRAYMVKGPETTTTPKNPSLAREIWNLPRGMTTTFDMSAPLRQGLPLIASKNWWTSWGDMVRAWGSEEAFKLVQKSIDDNPLFQKKTSTAWNQKTGELKLREEPSVAQKAGLGMTDLTNWTHREEVIQSQLIEKIPGFGRIARASNRAYTAFLNKLRADTFTDLMERQKSINGGQPVTDEQAAQIADFINDATGRGKMTTRVPFPHRDETTGKIKWLDVKERGPGNYRLAEEAATDVLFAPKLAASRIRMLNPLTYTDPKLSPVVRRQYLKAALSTASAWITMAGLGAIAQGDVSVNPTNADFGKIKFGDLRIDPGAGFQQFLVAYSRLLSGLQTSSTSGNVSEYGKGYRAFTLKDALEQVGSNKLHPFMKFAWDVLDASESKPVQALDRTAQLFVPLFLQDIAEIAKTEPNQLPPALAAAALSFFGMGSQLYGKNLYDRNAQKDWTIVPPGIDKTWEGGMLPGMEFMLFHIPGVDMRQIEKAKRRR